MKKKLLLAVSITLFNTVSVFAAEGSATAGKEKAAACAGCHGEDGNSEVSTFPKLAQQHASYLVNQLSAFKTGARKDPMMGPMATGLSEQDMLDIASFYTANRLKSNTTLEASSEEASTTSNSKEDTKKLFLEGQNLYRNGNLTTQVSACIACHGPYGDGNKPASYPLLKSQHSDYLAKTLTDFKNGERTDNTDNVMYMIAKKMSDQEIKAVATFLTTLK